MSIPCTDTEKRDPNNKRCRESKPILAHNAPSSSEKQIELVEGFFPQPSINVLGGESGLGKSPLAIQLAVCIAAGLPFLGMPVKQGIVLYCDYENYGAFWPMVDEISAALGLSIRPNDLYRLEFPTHEQIDKEVASLRPRLMVIDTLRFFDPEFESENTIAVNRLKHIRKAMDQFGFSTLLIHHPKKDDEARPRTPLNEVTHPVMAWMQCLSGAQALSQQTDVRLGIDRVARGQKGEILVRGYYRGRGEIGPFFLGRIYDEESGEPIRFERITGRDLLQKATQLSRDPKEYEAWPRLASLCGREFTNKEAKHALGVAEATLAKYLAAYVAAALLIKTGKGKLTRYRHGDGNCSSPK